MIPSREEPSALLARSWWEIFRNQRVSVSQVIVAALEGDCDVVDMRRALAIVAPSGYRGMYSPHKLGRWLARRGEADIPDGEGDCTYRFVGHGKARDGARMWQLTRQPSPIAEPLLPILAEVEV
jgi:hypothetical protein